MKARNYVFTVNNYTKKMLNDFHHVAKSLKKHKYISYGLEIAPTTGTKHIQAYIQLNDSQGYTFLHNYFNLKKRNKLVKFHIEVAKGTAKQNKDYNSKDGEYFEFGEPKKQGKRSDLLLLKKEISKNPKHLNKIVRKDDVTNNQQLKFLQNIQQYYFEHRNPKDPPIVLWIYGKSGIGKTKLIYDTFDDVCAVSSYSWIGTGYQQNECLLFDDFRKSDISFNELLKITDRYPFTVFYKGGQIPLNSKYIIFTSPRSIQQTYGHTYGFEDDEALEQLTRRVKQIDLNNTTIKNLKTYAKKL